MERKGRIASVAVALITLNYACRLAPGVPSETNAKTPPIGETNPAEETSATFPSKVPSETPMPKVINTVTEVPSATVNPRDENL